MTPTTHPSPATTPSKEDTMSTATTPTPTTRSLAGESVSVWVPRSTDEESVHDVASDLNALVTQAEDQHLRLEVNGRALNHLHPCPFRGWGTGSLSVATRSASSSGTHLLWFQPGHGFVVTFTRRR